MLDRIVDSLLIATFVGIAFLANYTYLMAV